MGHQRCRSFSTRSFLPSRTNQAQPLPNCDIAASASSCLQASTAPKDACFNFGKIYNGFSLFPWDFLNPIFSMIYSRMKQNIPAHSKKDERDRELVFFPQALTYPSLIDRLFYSVEDRRPRVYPWESIQFRAKNSAITSEFLYFSSIQNEVISIFNRLHFSLVKYVWSMNCIDQGSPNTICRCATKAQDASGCKSRPGNCRYIPVATQTEG